MTTRSRVGPRLAALLASLLLAAAACGDDDDDDGASEATTTASGTEAGSTTTAGGTATTAAGGGGTSDAADVNGDGKVVVGFVSAGDTNDGGFYEAQVTPSREFAEAQGWEFILVDLVRPNDAVAEMQNLARQDVDIIVSGGGSELVDATQQVSEEESEIAWILLGGSEQPTEFYANATQDYNEVHYLAGVAMALVLERTGGDTIGFIAGPELDFTQTAAKALEVGLHTRMADGEVLVTHTGDFNDAALGIEAATAQISQGADIIYPFLGGAARPVIDEALAADVLVAVQPENRCEGGDAAVSVVFSQGQYGLGLLEAFAAGEFEEGVQRVFHIGADPEQVNAIICDATPEEQEVLDQVAADIASGEIDPRAEVQAAG
jgi:basic membrane protein A